MMKAKSLIRETEIEPHELLLVKVIKVAISDARQTQSQSRQREALEFLWLCCPIVAERVGLPEPPHLPYLRGE